MTDRKLMKNTSAVKYVTEYPIGLKNVGMLIVTVEVKTNAFFLT